MDFRFSRALFDERGAHRNASTHHAVRMRRTEFEIPGSVVPRLFWPTAEAFLDVGAGFAVWVDGQLASVAFSRDELELGIETRPEWRGRGLAAIACHALIEHALSVGLEPVWSCRPSRGLKHSPTTIDATTPASTLPMTAAAYDSGRAGTSASAPARPRTCDHPRAHPRVHLGRTRSVRDRGCVDSRRVAIITGDTACPDTVSMAIDPRPAAAASSTVRP